MTDAAICEDFDADTLVELCRTEVVSSAQLDRCRILRSVFESGLTRASGFGLRRVFYNDADKESLDLSKVRAEGWKRPSSRERNV